MYKALGPHGKFNLVSGLPSSRRSWTQLSSAAKTLVMVALVAAGFARSLAAARVPVLQADTSIRRQRPSSPSVCPTASTANHTLGDASLLLQQSRFSQAADILEPLTASKCDPRASLLLAASFEALGDIRKAESTLIAAQAAWPANNSIAVSLARDYMNTKQVNKAVTALKHFQPDSTTPQQELEAATIVLITGHHLPTAQTVARLNYQIYPSAQSLLLLANTIQLEGRYKDVIALLQSKRAEYTRSAPFLVTLAESEFDANMFDDARQDLAQAVQLDTTLYQAHYLLGNVLMKQGDLEAASAEYHAVMNLAPDQPRTYYQLALVLRAQQHDADEEKLLLKATAIDSHFALAYAEMGRILLNQNRLPEAVTQLNLALANNSALEQPYNLLAKAYLRLGDLDKANAMTKRLSALRVESRQKTLTPVSTSH